MINLTSLHAHVRVWRYLSRWQTTDKTNTQYAQALADQAEIQCHHLALHRAYGCFAPLYPQWVQRRFDAEFLRQMTSGPVLPTGPELATAWDRQFGPLSSPPVRCRQLAELVGVANHFLACYERERTQLAAFDLPRI
ncbi:MAG: hypothetical protein DYG89_13985 [Caldilinea sp. CFX5]|nr:hypothetical protein [Caldilinea sp. CFX5]